MKRRCKSSSIIFLTLMLAVTLMIQPIMVFASDVANIDYSHMSFWIQKI